MRLPRQYLATVSILGLALLGYPAWAAEESSDLPPHLRGQVIVRVDGGTPAEEVRQIAAGLDALVGRPLSSWGLYLFRFDDGIPVSEVIAQLEKHPAVQYAEADVRVRAYGHGDEERLGALHGAGNRVVVAVIDTGMDLSHPAFSGRLWVNAGEVPNDGLDNDGNGYVDDVHGADTYEADGNPTGGPGDGAHGTMVAGRVLQGALDAGAAIMSLRTGPGPWLSLSAIVAAIDYAVANGAHVINMSFGSRFFSLAMYEAVRRAAEHGVLLVAAAGNEGRRLNSYPAAHPQVVSVAATDSFGRKTWWSNYGRTVDFSAPGDQVLTTNWGGGTARMSGTSFSSPFVAGVAARILAAEPGTAPSGVIERLRSFAEDIYPLNPWFLRGLLGQGWVDEEVAGRVAQALPLEPILPPEDRPEDEAALQGEISRNQEEVRRLQSDLSAAEREWASKKERLERAERELSEAEGAVQQEWRKLSDAWLAWYRVSFGRARASASERERLRRELNQAWDRLFAAFGARRDAQARQRVAQVEERQAREWYNRVSSRLQLARAMGEQLQRRLARAKRPSATQSQAASVQQDELHALIRRLQAMHEALGAGASVPVDGLEVHEGPDLRAVLPDGS